jgi:hypothetical protein
MMNDIKDGIENSALLKVIKDSLADARDTVQKLAQLFNDNVRQLRLEATEDVLNQLTQNIVDLQYVMEFIEKLREGMKFFNAFGLPSDPISHQDTGMNLFKEINSSIEAKDWIMLSDLIEYELAPLLIKEDEWIGTIEEKLKVYEV